MRRDLVDLGITSFLSTERSPQVTFRLGNGRFSSPGSVSADTLIIDCDTAVWVIEATRRLEALGRLRQDWNSYGGNPLEQSSKDLAIAALRRLDTQELPIPNVTLGSGGHVYMEWRGRGGELEVEFKNDAIEFVKESPDGNMEEGRQEEDPIGELENLTQWLMEDRA